MAFRNLFLRKNRQSFDRKAHRRIELIFLKLKKIKDVFSFFWTKCPLLFLGLILLLGIGFHFFFFSVIFFLLLIFTKHSSLSQNIFFVFTFFLGYLLLNFHIPNYYPPKTKLIGNAIFQVKSIHPSSKLEKILIYKGKILCFSVDGKKNLYNLPCSIIVSKYVNRPLANFTYKIKGEILFLSPFHVKLKPDKKSPWEPIKKRYSLVEVRFTAKNFVRSLLKKKFTSFYEYNLLSSLATGDVSNYFLQFCFARLGLQHILAISGFHFSMVLFFFSFCLSFFLKRKVTFYILIILTNLYALFLGFTPSILRTWVTIQIALIAKINNKRYFALNALGFALFIQLLCDPLSCLNLGFQLSYLCCLSIFLIYPLLRGPSKLFFPQRTKKEIKEHPFINRIIIYFSSYLKEALLLSFAINLTIVPLLLYYFHKFPIISLFYNLLIPPLITLLMFFLIFFCFSYFTCPFFLPIMQKNLAFLTKIIINFLFYPPTSCEFFIRTKAFNIQEVLIYLFSIFFISIFFKGKSEEDTQKSIFSFI